MPKLYEVIDDGGVKKAVSLSGGVGVINNLDSTSTTDALSANMGKVLNDALTADNNQLFNFGYDSATQKYGYWIKEADTDVFVPFSSGGNQQVATMILGSVASGRRTYTFDFDIKKFFAFGYHNGDRSSFSMIYDDSVSTTTFTRYLNDKKLDIEIGENQYFGIKSVNGKNIDFYNDNTLINVVFYAIGESVKEPLDLSELTKASMITATKGITKDYVVSDLTKVEFVIITNTANDTYSYAWYNGEQTIGQGSQGLNNHINSVVGNTINLTCTTSSGEWHIWAWGTV